MTSLNIYPYGPNALDKQLGTTSASWIQPSNISTSFNSSSWTNISASPQPSSNFNSNMSQQNVTNTSQLVHPHQRRLRHVKGVTGRNIRAFTPPSQSSTSRHMRYLCSCFFTIHSTQAPSSNSLASIIGRRNTIRLTTSVNLEDSSDISGIFYQSEVIKDSQNPCWKSFDKDFFPSEILSLSTFIIRLWSYHSDRPPVKLLELQVDLKDLQFVSPNYTQLKNTSFLPNTFILELVDGFYRIVPPTVDNYSPKNALVSSQENSNTNIPQTPSTTKPIKLAPSFTASDFLNLVIGYKQKQGAIDESDELNYKIQELLLQRQESLRKKQQKQNLIIRIQQLKQDLQNQKNQLVEEKELVQSKRASILPRIRHASSAQVSLLASRKLLEEDYLRLERNKELLNKVETCVQNKKLRLISQLKIFYPITQGPHYTIGTLKLPNSDFTGCDEEQIAAALGMVCHVICILSKYLEIPLRYPMIPMCSRSIIRDDISQQVSPKFPLYSRGVDKTRFEYGVFLLNKNLEQLLNSLNVDVHTLRNTLPNLHILLTKLENPSSLSGSSSSAGDSSLTSSMDSTSSYVNIKEGFPINQ